jgi:hypothetical protein
VEKWEYAVALVNKWGRATRLESKESAEPYQFNEQEAMDLVTLLREAGAVGWELVAVDPNITYGQGPHSYVGSLYIFQRPL